jgi:Arc/MetJ-type ribon-helix-helix transcriptional regulator
MEDMSENYTEKVSVNMNAATLASIDLLVDGGYYSNRSDFINQAVREGLQRQQSTVDRLVARNEKKVGDWFMGVFALTAADVEQMYASSERMRIRGYGILILDRTCDTDKLFAVVEDIELKGKAICAPAVKEHYGLK